MHDFYRKSRKCFSYDLRVLVLSSNGLIKLDSIKDMISDYQHQWLGASTAIFVCGNECHRFLHPGNPRAWGGKHFYIRTDSQTNLRAPTHSSQSKLVWKCKMNVTQLITGYPWCGFQGTHIPREMTADELESKGQNLKTNFKTRK